MYYTVHKEQYMEERTALINVRIEPSLKAAFEQMAKAMDRTPSQLVRDSIRRIVQQYAAAHAQGALDLAPTPSHTTAPKKPAKGQKMASLAQARRGKA